MDDRIINYQIRYPKQRDRGYAEAEVQRIAEGIAAFTADEENLRKLLREEDNAMARALRDERRLTPEQLNRWATI